MRPPIVWRVPETTVTPRQRCAQSNGLGKVISSDSRLSIAGGRIFHCSMAIGSRTGSETLNDFMKPSRSGLPCRSIMPA